MQHARMHLTVLPFHLKVAKLKKDQIESCAFAVMKLLLFTERTDRFFSLTVAEEELSFVIDQEDLSAFPPNSLEVFEVTWRPIQVDEGSAPSSVTPVNHLSGPLAQAGISIFYISTNQSDFVLVPESRLHDAVNSLNKEFFVVIEGLDSFEQESKPFESTTPKRHLLAVPPARIFTGNIQRELLPTIGTFLLQAIFFVETNPNGFFSYTATEDEISILCTEQSKTLFPDEFFNGETWKLIKVADGPLGFSEFGIVHSIAEPLSSEKITLFYISTFSTDFTLVQESEIAKSVNCLKKTFPVK